MTEHTAALAALQAALAGEHAAVWASGRAAAELGSRREQAQGELDAHRRAREDLRGQVTALGGVPVAAAAAYVEPFPVAGAGGARRLMAHVNEALVVTYADLAAATPAGERAASIDSGIRAATRAVAWGAAAQAFPGSR